MKYASGTLSTDYELCQSRVSVSRVAEVGSLSARAKNGHKSFCQTRISSFRDKCDVFLRNYLFGNLTQYNMQCIPCNSVLLAKEALFLTPPKKTFFVQRFPKSA